MLLSSPSGVCTLTRLYICARNHLHVCEQGYFSGGPARPPVVVPPMQDVVLPAFVALSVFVVLFLSVVPLSCLSALCSSAGLYAATGGEDACVCVWDVVKKAIISKAVSGPPSERDPHSVSPGTGATISSIAWHPTGVCVCVRCVCACRRGGFFLG